MASIDRLAGALFTRQHGVLSRKQALNLGYSTGQIHRRTTTGEWQTAERAVYRHSMFESSWLSQVAAATLSFNALASHRTAGVLWDLDGVHQRKPEVVVTTRRSVQPSHLVLHESTQMDRVDKVYRNGIACTGLARTLLDLGSVVPFTVLRQAADDARRRSLVEWQDLQATLLDHARRGRNGVRAMRRYLEAHGEHEVIPLSDWSRRVADLLHASGLPYPKLEHAVTKGGRHVASLDLAYPSRKLGIELDSVAFHHNLESFHRDPVRRNKLENAGWSIRNFTWKDFSDHPARLVQTVHDAFYRM